jgi:hypothetical protein
MLLFPHKQQYIALTWPYHHARIIWSRVSQSAEEMMIHMGKTVLISVGLVLLQIIII